MMKCEKCKVECVGTSMRQICPICSRETALTWIPLEDRVVRMVRLLEDTSFIAGYRVEAALAMLRGCWKEG
jgi:hypothetical protein